MNNDNKFQELIAALDVLSTSIEALDQADAVALRDAGIRLPRVDDLNHISDFICRAIGDNPLE